MEELDKNSPFKTPEGYFDNLTDKLKDKLSEEKLNLPEGVDFTIPEDYFDNLKNSIQEKITLSETKVVQLHPYKRYYVAAASIAAIFVMLIGLNWNATGETTWDDLANADIETYFDTNELGLTTFEIAEVLPIDELEIDDILENQFEEENVIDYLNENIDDIKDLNLEDYE